MNTFFLLLAATTFLQVQAGPTELFENFLKTNPSADNLAKELDTIKNVSVKSVALKKLKQNMGLT